MSAMPDPVFTQTGVHGISNPTGALRKCERIPADSNDLAILSEPFSIYWVELDLDSWPVGGFFPASKRGHDGRIFKKPVSGGSRILHFFRFPSAPKRGATDHSGEIGRASCRERVG